MERDVELQIVSRLRQGDPSAFDAVYDAFHNRLYNFLARLSGSRDVAEDLLEETWLRLVTHADRLDPETRLRAWLFTVARHLHTSYRRSRRVEELHTADLPTLWPAPTPRTPLEAAETSEAQRRLAAALASLPVHYREVLLLVGVEGLRPSEAAEVCDIRADALRQRLSRARALLAERLAQSEAAVLLSLKEVRS